MPYCHQFLCNVPDDWLQTLCFHETLGCSIKKYPSNSTIIYSSCFRTKCSCCSDWMFIISAHVRGVLTPGSAQVWPCARPTSLGWCNFLPSSRNWYGSSKATWEEDFRPNYKKSEKQIWAKCKWDNATFAYNWQHFLFQLVEINVKQQINPNQLTLTPL